MSNILKKLKRDKRKKKEYPFVVHQCPIKCTCETCRAKMNEENEDNWLYPTHTHGLNTIFMPDMVIDPLSFGMQNVNIINEVYEYLIRPENKDMVPRILNGETIATPMSDMDKMSKFTPSAYEGSKDLVLCLRAVYRDFEAIKQAYNTNDFSIEELPEDFPFLQIYVLGDDFALEDEYYKGGVAY